MKAPRAPWAKRDAGQRQMENVLRCAEALQHWPLDRIEKAMASAEAELIEKHPSLAGPLEMIRRAQPHGMDAIAAMWRDAHERTVGLVDHVPFSASRKKRLKEFVTLAKLRCLLIQRACPKASRREDALPFLPPVAQVEMKLPGLTGARA